MFFKDLFRNKKRDSTKQIAHSVTPVQWLVLGYAFITLAAAVLLALPVSSATGHAHNFINTLFMAASGISTTGLATIDPGSEFSLFGQIVLLFLFQIGGIGYMPLFIISFSFFAPRQSLVSNMIARESTAFADYINVKNFFAFILAFTFICELAGALALCLAWFDPTHPLFSAYSGLFHSISAFCTAGFSLHSDSLMRYQYNIIVNIVIIVESLLGGIGFFVVYNILTNRLPKLMGTKKQRLSLHSKLALLVTCLVLAGSTVLVFLAENWKADTTPGQRWLLSFFQTVSASTTDGFNTIDIGKMGTTGLTVIIILMFIGASPGSTGGGIKTTTLGVIALFMISLLRGKANSPTIYKRGIAQDVIMKSLAIFTWSIFFIVFDLLIMLQTEKASFLEIIFEIFSALGNTGLSMGITTKLSSIGKILLSITMFVGRVGPVTIGLSLLSLLTPSRQLPFHLPKEDVFVG